MACCRQRPSRAQFAETRCKWCGVSFRHSRPAKKREFCGLSCAGKWRAKYRPIPPEQRKLMSEKAAAARKGRPNPGASARMKRLNGDPEFRAKVDAISRSRKGRPWLGKRGGNGQITVPQEKLRMALGLPRECLEHPIKTKPVRDRFDRIPPCYKVDIALPEHRLAIEVDGRSHDTKRVKASDRKMEAVLSSLGWKVLRFSNAAILENPEAIASTIWKSLETTTTSPMES